MATLGLEFHYAFTLLGTAPQFTYTDATGPTTYDIWIPPGQYYFKHETAAKDIRDVIKNLVTAATGLTFSFTTSNDRQVTFNLDNALDTMLLVDTNNGDNEKLALALGIYKDDDLDHFTSNNITDGYVMPNVLGSWFATGGRTFETEDMDGFDVTPGEVYRTEGGAHSSAAGSHKAEVGMVKFTGIEGDAVRGGWEYATQAAAGVTINATWTASIWRASWPEHFDPVFYSEIGDTPYKREYAQNKLLERGDVRQLRPGWTQNFNMDMDLIMREDLT